MDSIIKKIPFEEFEKAVMQKIMEKNTPINFILREQYKYAHIRSRKFTGVGFFTDFKVPATVPRITEKVEYAYGDVSAVINNIYGFGFILFIEKGRMIFLEGYTWEDAWPDQIHSFGLIQGEIQENELINIVH